MNLEKDGAANTLKITLSLADLAQLTTQRFVLVESCGQEGIIEDQSIIVSYSRLRKLAKPCVYLEESKLAVILPHLFLPVEIEGIRGRDENYVTTDSISRDFTTIVDVDRTEL